MRRPLGEFTTVEILLARVDSGRMETTRNVALSADGLSVRRGKKQVLKDLEFDVIRGSVTGLLGPSGGGKTTLMRAIVGVQAGVSGSLTVLGEPAGARALRSRIGYVTQAVSVYEDLTVTENLRFFAKLLGAPRAQVARVIEQVDLGSHAGELARNLSGGQRSRVSLAAALLGNPELLVLDEPTVGLDPVLRVELWRLFAELAEAGTTIIVSSHVMDEAEHCSRLLLLREGELIADSSPEALLRDTHTTDVESAFLELVR